MKMLTSGIVAVLGMTLSATASAEDYKIGVVQSLTGGYAFVGVPQTNGAKQAAADLNAQNFLGEGNRIVLVIEDDANDRGQTATAIHRIGLQKDILGIVGPANAATAIAIAPQLNEHKIVNFSISSTTTPIGISPWYFKIGGESKDSVIPIAEYAIKKGKHERFAIVSTLDHESHMNQVKILREHLKEANIPIVIDDGIQARDTDFAAIATKVAQAKPDGIFIGIVGVPAANMAIALRQAGIGPEVRLYGTAGLSGDYAAAGGQAVNNTFAYADYNPSRPDELNQNFVKNYTATYKEPPENFSATGYAQVMVLAQAIKNAMPNPTREKVRDEVMKLHRIPSVLGGGTWSMTETHVPTFDPVVMEVKDGKLQAAP